MKSVDVAKAFHDIGYTWNDASPIPLRSIPGYTFDPISNEHLSSMDDEDDDDDYIEKVAAEISQQQQASVTSIQLKLINMWKRKN